tara:strand:+ start:272 stop:1363 length:1092 start_codon:yes stop_codon:yes gene_type:complete
MINIAHFGSYNINVGDNIALLNIRKGIEKLVNKAINWNNIDIKEFHDSPMGMNSIEYAKLRMRDISSKNDMLIIGGGGLIESNKRKDNETKWKLPFNEEILNCLDIPVVCFALGINYFRNFPELDKEAITGLKALKDKSALFSLRNDGSTEIYEKIYNEKCTEVPDPGMIFDKSLCKSINTEITTGFLQPAWNNNLLQMTGRGFTQSNLMDMIVYCRNNNLKVVPHTLKDYNFPYNNFYYSRGEFSTLVKFNNFEQVIEDYHSFDYSVPMRGHGQLISVGINIPSIYFSTQDKVRDFSKRNDLSQYNVDIGEQHWQEKLQEKTNLLKSDKNFLLQWYEKREKLVIKCQKQFEVFCERIQNIVE